MYAKNIRPSAMIESRAWGAEICEQSARRECAREAGRFFSLCLDKNCRIKYNKKPILNSKEMKNKMMFRLGFY